MEMVNPMSLSGKRVLVTGASSGIGRATAVLFSQLGATLVLTGRDQDRLEETQKSLEGNGHIAIPLELREFDKYAEVFREIRSTGEKLSGFVHCAGVANVIPLKVASAHNIHEMFDVNFVSFMELTKHYCKRANSHGGSIVCMSSLSAHYPAKCMSIYAATKGALEMAVSSLAVEFFDKNIRFNAVIPGTILTPMTKTFAEVAAGESGLSDRQGKPEDIANMAAYLVSDAAAFITGRKFYVDGGRL